jgi:hypothetical protein
MESNEATSVLKLGDVTMALTNERMRQIQERLGQIRGGLAEAMRADRFDAGDVNYWYMTDTADLIREVAVLRQHLAEMVLTYEHEAGDTPALKRAKANLTKVWGEWETQPLTVELQPAPTEQPATDVSGGDTVE